MLRRIPSLTTLRRSCGGLLVLGTSPSREQALDGTKLGACGGSLTNTLQHIQYLSFSGILVDNGFIFFKEEIQR